jgi:mono/diheme cytochrome c family protein
VPLALSAGQKTGIAVVAAVFVAFALASSFLLPRRWPDFPGRGVRAFVVLSALLFVGMMSTMIALAKESEEETDHPPATAAAGGEEGEEGEPAGPAQGDAAAGKEVFASAGCGSCHTLGDAGSTGAVGPNLDDAMPTLALAVERVTNGQGVMPSFREQLSPEQIRDVATYVSEAAGGDAGGTETETAGTETGAAAPEAQGDPAAGKEVFASAGCGSCHTLADAGSTGVIGPNLDDAMPSAELAVERVTNGQGAMPSFEGQLSEEQIRDVAAYVSQTAGQ